MAMMQYLGGRLSSGEIPTAAPERFDDVEYKHRRLAEFLAAHEYDALLLQKPENFAWVTSGGDCTRTGSKEVTAALFITPGARVVVCSNIETGQLFDKEVSGLGFQLKERPWFEPKQLLLGDLCRGRKVASDTGFAGTKNVTCSLAPLRSPLTEIECERMRTLGRHVAHAVEATARGLEAGRTEAEIAGEIAHRLTKHQVHPVQLQVQADGRGKLYRHWGFGPDAARRSCVLGAVGSRWGLCAAAVRTVTFGPPEPELVESFRSASMVHATALYFSQADSDLSSILDRARRIYEKCGAADEWRLADQGSVIGYEVCEVPVTPKSAYRIAPGTPLYWHPSVGPALVGDTILVQSGGFEILTPTEAWPNLEISVKDAMLSVPDILQRP
jgi:Xaa-Pro aminopeptidase